MKAVTLVLFTLLFVSHSVKANLITYSVSGIIEDDTQSTSVIFGGDGDTFSTADDGSTFDIMFSLNSFDTPDEITDIISIWTSYEYFSVLNPQFFLNGIEHSVGQINADFTLGIDSLRLLLQFNDDAFYGITSLFVDVIGTDLFESTPENPPLIRSENHSTGAALGRDGVYSTRSLSVASQAASVNEPGAVIIFISALTIFFRHKSNELNSAVWKRARRK